MSPDAAAILVVVAVLVCWRVSVAVWPWRRCPRCGGSGRGIGSSPDRWSVCGRCRGERVTRRR